MKKVLLFPNGNYKHSAYVSFTNYNLQFPASLTETRHHSENTDKHYTKQMQIKKHHHRHKSFFQVLTCCILRLYNTYTDSKLLLALKLNSFFMSGRVKWQ